MIFNSTWSSEGHSLLVFRDRGMNPIEVQLKITSPLGLHKEENVIRVLGAHWTKVNSVYRVVTRVRTGISRGHALEIQPSKSQVEG